MLTFWPNTIIEWFVKQTKGEPKTKKAVVDPDADFFAQTPLPCDLLVKQSKGKSKSRKTKIFSLNIY